VGLQRKHEGGQYPRDVVQIDPNGHGGFGHCRHAQRDRYGARPRHLDGGSYDAATGIRCALLQLTPLALRLSLDGSSSHPYSSCAVIPGFALLPNQFIRELIRITSLFDRRFRSFHRQFVVELQAEVEALRAEGRNVVIVGHSLGGGAAKIVGMLTQTPCVSFSGPGLFYTSTKYADLAAVNNSVLLRRLETFAVNIRPARDPVSCGVPWTKSMRDPPHRIPLFSALLQTWP
jgi:hypothetical protein